MTVDHVAIGRRSKGKGANGELEVGRLLTPWWRRFEPEACFIRSPGSGGWRHAKRFGARGDLMHDPDTCQHFCFTLEVKRRENWSVPHFLSGKASPVWSWWEQSQKAAADSGRAPMLWFRKNNRRKVWFVMIEAEVYDRLRLRGMSPPVVRFGAPRHTVVLTDAQTLWIPPQAFFRATRPVDSVLGFGV